LASDSFWAICLARAAFLLAASFALLASASSLLSLAAYFFILTAIYYCNSAESFRSAAFLSTGASSSEEDTDFLPPLITFGLVSSKFKSYSLKLYYLITGAF